MQFMRIAASIAGIVTLAGASIALADIGDPVITFQASGSAGSGSYTVSVDDGAWSDGSWFWAAVSPIEIRSDSGDLILTVNQGSAFIDEDPVVALGFAVTAGSSDTTFTITSSTVSFPTIANAQGRASAGMTLTESDGDTATILGLEAGGTMFEARYNGANVFTNLLAGPFVENTAYDTQSTTDEFPGGGAFANMGAVSDISVEWSFELTANDQASGTSVFVVIPTPASLALIGFAGLGVIRRRR